MFWTNIFFVCIWREMKAGRGRGGEEGRRTKPTPTTQSGMPEASISRYHGIPIERVDEIPSTLRQICYRGLSGGALASRTTLNTGNSAETRISCHHGGPIQYPPQTPRTSRQYHMQNCIILHYRKILPMYNFSRQVYNLLILRNVHRNYTQLIVTHKRVCSQCGIG